MCCITNMWLILVVEKSTECWQEDEVFQRYTRYPPCLEVQDGDQAWKVSIPWSKLFAIYTLHSKCTHKSTYQYTVHNAQAYMRNGLLVCCAGGCDCGTNGVIVIGIIGWGNPPPPLAPVPIPADIPTPIMLLAGCDLIWFIVGAGCLCWWNGLAAAAVALPAFGVMVVVPINGLAGAAVGCGAGEIRVSKLTREEFSPRKSFGDFFFCCSGVSALDIPDKLKASPAGWLGCNVPPSCGLPAPAVRNMSNSMSGSAGLVDPHGSEAVAGADCGVEFHGSEAAGCDGGTFVGEPPHGSEVGCGAGAGAGAGADVGAHGSAAGTEGGWAGLAWPAQGSLGIAGMPPAAGGPDAGVVPHGSLVTGAGAPHGSGLAGDELGPPARLSSVDPPASLYFKNKNRR